MSGQPARALDQSLKEKKPDTEREAVNESSSPVQLLDLGQLSDLEPAPLWQEQAGPRRSRSVRHRSRTRRCRPQGVSTADSGWRRGQC